MKQGFVIHHNGPNTGLSGKPHSACQAYWAGVDRYHDQRWGNGIVYSFGVCHHGERFVGRGWDRNQGANGEDVVGDDDGRDSEWYSVLVFLGWNADPDNPVDEEPSASMLDGVRDVITEGRSSNRCGTRVLPHNAFKPKRCPGATFTRLASQWDRAPLTAPGDDMTPEQERLLRRVHDALGLAGKDDKYPLQQNIAGRVAALYVDMKAGAAGEDVDVDELAAAIQALPAKTVAALKAAL